MAKQTTKQAVKKAARKAAARPARKAVKKAARRVSKEERVNFHLLVQDEPGVIQSVSAVFAGRGVSMDAVLAHRTFVHDAAKRAEVTVTLRATPNRQRMILRALERVRFVERVLLVPEDSPRIGEAALVEVRPGSGAPFFDGVSCFPVDAPKGGPRRLLLYGRPDRVLEAIRVMREAEILVSARFTRFLLEDHDGETAAR